MTDIQHQPKGSMCMACIKQWDDCSSLDFKAMPMMMRLPPSYGNAIVVRCTAFEAGTRAECAAPVKSRLELEHSTTPKQLQDLVRPLFLWMHDHGIDKLAIDRDGTLANVTVNGKPV